MVPSCPPPPLIAREAPREEEKEEVAQLVQEVAKEAAEEVVEAEARRRASSSRFERVTMSKRKRPVHHRI